MASKQELEIENEALKKENQELKAAGTAGLVDSTHLKEIDSLQTDLQKVSEEKKKLQTELDALKKKVEGSKGSSVVSSDSVVLSGKKCDILFSGSLREAHEHSRKRYISDQELCVVVKKVE